jgi:putative transposase
MGKPSFHCSDLVQWQYHTTTNPTLARPPTSDDTPAALGALQVDEAKLRGHVDEVVRSSGEETLNGLLDAEADQICRAQPYERSAERVDGRAGHYERKLEHVRNFKWEPRHCPRAF